MKLYTPSTDASRKKMKFSEKVTPPLSGIRVYSQDNTNDEHAELSMCTSVMSIPEELKVEHQISVPSTNRKNES